MKWWLTLVTTLLLSPSASSSSDGFPRKFFASNSPHPLKRVTTDSDSDGGWGDVNQQQSGIKRKMSQAGLNTSSDLDFLGINKDVTDFFTMPTNNIAASLADISQSRTLPPLHQASTPILGRRIIPEPTSNDSLTSGRMGSSASSVYSCDNGYESSTSTSSTLPPSFVGRSNVFSTAPFGIPAGLLGTGTFSLSDSQRREFIGNTLFYDQPSLFTLESSGIPQYPLLGQPQAPIQGGDNFVFSSESASRLRLGQSAADESAEGSSAVKFDPDDAFAYDYLDNLLNSFDMEQFAFPVEEEEEKDAKIKPVLSADSASTASDLLEGLNFDDFPQIPQPQQQQPAQQFELSPKARAYSFSDAFLRPSESFDGTAYDPRPTSGSPLFGKPLTRLDAQIRIDSPMDEATVNASNNQMMISESNREFLPWLPESPAEIFAPIDDAVFKQKFGLDPFPPATELSDSEDTDASRKFFPANFKPFFDYGEIEEDAAQMARHLENVKEFSRRVTAQVATIRAEKLKARYKDDRKSRHVVDLEYAKRAGYKGWIEGDWIHRILAGAVLEYFDLPLVPKSVHEHPWTVKRGRLFINALIPSVFHSLHAEENLIDFMEDFFLVKVVKKANDLMQTEADRIALSKELTLIATEMIKHLVPSAIFEKFISYVQPIFVFEDAEILYATLVNTMKEFKLPKPFVAPTAEEPVAPLKDDPKYNKYRKKHTKENAYMRDFENYKAAMREYRKFEENVKLQKSYHAEHLRAVKNQKYRSFEFLKVLVLYLADPIMKPNSRWINGSFLRMQTTANETEMLVVAAAVDSDSEDESKKPKATTDELIFGPNAHENQDFFDALFFARILRACLILDHTVSFVEGNLDPFFNEYKFLVSDSPIGLRYLKAVNKFILITRFNVVANVHPQIISFRRYLAAYLCRNGASLMGIDPAKVQARSISMELFSLFESIHLYQVFGVLSETEIAERLKVMIGTRGISFQIPIIFLTYNILDYLAIAKVIEGVFTSNRSISASKLNAYYEIFAMIKNVNLLSIYDRKVLKFIGKDIQKAPEESFYKLDSINQNMPLREKLPDDYQAVYEWSMSRKLKNLSTLDVHLSFPYGTFAVRMLLARQFGIPMDATKFSAQFGENFTWLEGIGFANFFLEREAQFLIDKSYLQALDSDLYQVYRVIDPQDFIHKARALPRDEPTHHINVLIHDAVSQLTPEERADLRFDDPTVRKTLFDRYYKALKFVAPLKIYQLTPEEKLDILIFFADETKRPEDFKVSDYPVLV